LNEDFSFSLDDRLYFLYRGLGCGMQENQMKTINNLQILAKLVVFVQILFVAAKLVGLDWGWVWILTPLWAGGGLLCATVIVAVLVLIIIDLMR
jgi:hypothetical protein